jgi:hypothetical protein
MGNSILDRRVRNIIIGTVAATVVFGAGLAFFLFSYLGKEEDAVTEKTAEFIAAIEKNDPGAAPEGGDEYVTGIRNAYGPIQEIRSLDRRKKSSGSGNNSRSWWVSEFLLKSERGAAVLEIRWATSGFLKPGNQNISQVYELEPGKVHSSLSKEDGDAIKRGFKARGSDVFDSFDLNPTFQRLEPGRIGKSKPPAEAEPPADVEPTPVPDAPSPEEVEKEQRLAEKERKRIEREQRKADRRLKCVQDAKGDVNKLQKCAQI